MCANDIEWVATWQHPTVHRTQHPQQTVPRLRKPDLKNRDLLYAQTTKLLERKKKIENFSFIITTYLQTKISLLSGVIN